MSCKTPGSGLLDELVHIPIKTKDNLEYLCHPFCLDHSQYMLAVKFRHDIHLFRKLQGRGD